MTFEHQPPSTSPEYIPERPKNIQGMFRGAIEAMRRSDAMNKVRIARSGLWQGEPTLIIPSSGAQGPLDNRGVIDASRLTGEELRLAVDMRLLSREVLLRVDQERLDQERLNAAPVGAEPSVITGLYQKIGEDMERFTPETPNYP